MRSFLVFCAALFACGSAAFAADWPKWMGPDGDNVWREDGVLTKFPKSGLKVVWKAPVAGGYAGPAVSSGRVYVTDYVTKDNVKVSNFDRKEFTGRERVLCLDEASGKLIWKHEYDVKYDISYPAGPRCTPVVEGNRVYTLGAEGNLFCFVGDYCRRSGLGQQANILYNLMPVDKIDGLVVGNILREPFLTPDEITSFHKWFPVSTVSLVKSAEEVGATITMSSFKDGNIITHDEFCIPQYHHHPCHFWGVTC